MHLLTMSSRGRATRTDFLFLSKEASSHLGVESGVFVGQTGWIGVFVFAYAFCSKKHKEIGHI